MDTSNISFLHWFQRHKYPHKDLWYCWKLSAGAFWLRQSFLMLLIFICRKDFTNACNSKLCNWPHVNSQWYQDRGSISEDHISIRVNELCYTYDVTIKWDKKVLNNEKCLFLQLCYIFQEGIMVFIIYNLSIDNKIYLLITFPRSILILIRVISN